MYVKLLIKTVSDWHMTFHVRKRSICSFWWNRVNKEIPYLIVYLSFYRVILSGLGYVMCLNFRIRRRHKSAVAVNALKHLSSLAIFLIKVCVGLIFPSRVSSIPPHLLAFPNILKILISYFKNNRNKFICLYRFKRRLI